EITAAHMQKPPLSAATAGNLHAGADGVAIALLAVADQLQTEPVMGRGGGVAQQADGPAVVAVGEIGPAVVVEIGPGQAATDQLLAEIRPCLARYVAELPLAIAQKQLGFLRERLVDLVRIAEYMAIGGSDVQ